MLQMLKEVMLQQESILTPCWICFFHFNLCFWLLLFTIRIMFIHNGLLQGNLTVCLNMKITAFVQDRVHLWMGGRKKLTHLLSKACPPTRYLQNEKPFYFISSPPHPHLYSIKESGIQILRRWLFWDISLPSS